jgi:hypothetical protein
LNQQIALYLHTHLYFATVSPTTPHPDPNSHTVLFSNLGNIEAIHLAIIREAHHIPYPVVSSDASLPKGLSALAMGYYYNMQK